MDSNNSSNPRSSDGLSHNVLTELEYALFCVQVALSVIGILGNSLVCITIAKATFMHNVTNFLIAHLAVADILVCVTVITFQERYMESSDLVHENTAQNEIFCKFFYGKRIIWAACNISIFSVVSVTVERYVGIVHPLKYPSLFTRVKVGLMIAVIWTISLSLKIPYLVVPSYDSSTHQCFNDGLSETNTFVIYLIYVLSHFELGLPAVIIFGCYWKILINLQRAAQDQQQDNNHAPANELLVARRRVIKVLLVVSVLYILIWVQINFLFAITIFSNNLPFEVSHALNAVQPTLAVLNSVVNPLVYAFKYKEFQRGMRYHVFPCRCRSRRVAAAVSTMVHVH